MASSTHEQLHHLPNQYGTTTAPPPTPSTTQPNPQSSSDHADVLSRLLHRLPPTLSLPTRRSPPTTAAATAAISPPLISLSPQSQNTSKLLSAASELGFFQLANHSVPPQLARSAESDSISLFSLPREQKPLLFPKNWPLGFDGDEDENGANESFCLDSACSTESTELSLASLREFTREMEKVGMEVVEALSCAVGFENPAREDPTRVCSLMWISDGTKPGYGPGAPGRLYPYVVGLEYQIRCQKYSLLSDSGWVSVSPQVGSILVTLGDIAQVWSNGKIKKVRGRAVPDVGDEVENAQHKKYGISMCLVVSLPLESSVSPRLIPRLTTNANNDNNIVGVGDGDDGQEKGEDNKDDKAGGNAEAEAAAAAAADAFQTFSFEDYAWRVYHERLLLKDPLDRYRII
ncbi:gibberellin 2-beta-dioxygenase 2 [Diospyros lotus]|uniref:gibberellin 2-beta-dioxygenase 2 n=1 Tax=Diospyros lotus TaxID=55363 RepID=UPI0022572C95|nr:gibberellin 2-beta-dioxygenase 2 [Diospyros lotus]